MHCMDCGNKLETVNYVESCTKYLCSKCNVHWFQSRVVRVEWSKKIVVLESDNGGIQAPVTTTKLKHCCECQNVINIRGHYGVNGDLFYCSDCMNTDF